MELDFDKYCVVDGSPTTVLPAVRHSKVPNRRSNGKPKHGNHMLSDSGGFTEIRFDNYRSVSCKDTRSRRSNQEDIKMPKRVSAYQSPKEVMLLKRSDAAPERKKIEFSGGSETVLPFGIIDSLCNSDEDTLPADQDMFSVMSGSEQSTSSFCNEPTEIHPRGSINYAFHPISERNSQKKTSSVDERGQSTRQSVQEDLTITSESAAASMFGGSSLHRRNPDANLHKSLSAKLALPRSPVQHKSGDSKSSSSDFQFSPSQKIFDPFVRSQSGKSPLSRVSETGFETSDNGTLHRSLLNASLDKQHFMGYNSHFERNVNCKAGPLYSPAHLHGLLKVKTKRGIPFFKFSVKSPGEIYVARTWKVDTTLNWIYTFHSVNQRRNNNAIEWRFKDNNRGSFMVGQMLVSCYLSTEIKVAGASSDSMVTDFVLYDVNCLRKSNSSQDNSSCSLDASKLLPASDETQLRSEKNKISTRTQSKVQVKHSSDSGQLESSAPKPLAAEKLYPGLEIAAITLQVPFKKRESLKFKSGDSKIDTPYRLLDLCQLDEVEEVISDAKGPGKMHVVIPAGHHSLPSTESRGPSPLLDRWRLGGVCDCGGWDLACPLTVFSNPKFHVVGSQPLLGNQYPAELFHEGRRDDTPAFSMKSVEEGKYAVNFHAQLSSLQAFSICVALLHAAEASTAERHERHRQSLQSDSPRVIFAEKEIERFKDAIMEEQNLKPNKITEGTLPSFVVTPPFSPIARV